MTLRDLYLIAKNERYTLDRRYEIGETSEKTGLKKVAPGVWVKPEEKENNSRELKGTDRISVKAEYPKKTKKKGKNKAHSAHTVYSNPKLNNLGINVQVSDVNKKNMDKITDLLCGYTKKYNLKKLLMIKTDDDLGAAAASNRGLLTLSTQFVNDPKLVRNNKKEYTKDLEADEQNILNKIQRAKTKGVDTAPLEDKLIINSLQKKADRECVIYDNLELESVIAHEMGHIIADQKIGQITGNPNTKACKKIRKVYMQARESEQICKISGSAIMNPKEFFAECFTIYQMGKEEVPDYIKDMIEEVVYGK